ncbi:Zinc finger CCCH domain-containing protein [Ranunculus cassubicifolius]
MENSHDNKYMNSNRPILVTLFIWLGTLTSYHQNVLENHNTFGQSEAMFSTNPLAKRPRVETATNLPIYPQRPGEKDCTHYMLTRTCKFGEACMFDHPIWVPEGGIPDWKEVPLAPSETLPERPGEADCPYFLKTQKCKFGFRCKFNHPKDKAVIPPSNAVETTSVLPERPSEPTCTFYMKTGKCRFGAVCKFHHPKDIEIPPPEQPGQHENDNGVLSEYGVNSVLGTTRIGGDPNLVKPLVNNYAPAMLHNSKGLPMRQGEADCPFYLKTGSCKYGATCRYNHPPGISSSGVSSNGTMMINPAVAAANNMNFGGPLNPLVPPINPRFAQTTTMQQLGFGVGPLPPPSNISIYPQRPGQTECDYYMKTGVCKFGERCKFHHPFNRSAPAPNQPTAVQQQQPSVVLTLAGLPRREGAIICPFYMKTGTCKYGVQCRYDHPPPGEAIKMAAATLQGGATSSVAATSGEEDKVGGGDETSTLQQQ